MIEPDKIDPSATYTATISPWRGGWEIAINGPGIVDGATQAATVDDVLYMTRDYILCSSNLDEQFDEEAIKVDLTLNLEHPCGERSNVALAADGQRIVETIRWEVMQDPGE